MIIEFKLDDYYDICDEYQKILEEAGYEEVNDDDENTISVCLERIAIPEIHASFRSGEWYSRNEAPDGKEEWIYQTTVMLQYEENEKNINEFISYGTESLLETAHDVCLKMGMKDVRVGSLKCYIDTSEFA